MSGALTQKLMKGGRPQSEAGCWKKKEKKKKEIKSCDDFMISQMFSLILDRLYVILTTKIYT